MQISLSKIAHSRSGDKGLNSNVGLLFYSSEIYEWAKIAITVDVVKKHFQSIIKGNVIRYEMDNLLALKNCFFLASFLALYSAKEDSFPKSLELKKY